MLLENQKLPTFASLDDFRSWLSNVFCGRIKEDINVVRCLSVSHGAFHLRYDALSNQQSYSFVFLHHKSYSIFFLLPGFFCSVQLFQHRFLLWVFDRKLLLIQHHVDIYLRIFFRAEMSGCKVSSWSLCAAGIAAQKIRHPMPKLYLPFSFIKRTALLNASSSSLCS